MRTTSLAATLVLFAGFHAGAQQFGIDFAGGGGTANNDGWNLGYEFQVTSPVTIVGLAAWDGNTPGGLSQAVPVGLWRNDGSLLASATIAAGTLPSDPGDQFADVGIAPITLSPGLYDVAALDPQIFGGFWPSLQNFTEAPGINYVQDRFAYGGLDFPGQTDSGFYGANFNGWFGGNIVTEAAEVPDGGPCFLLLTGTCLVLGIVRRKLR